MIPGSDVIIRKGDAIEIPIFPIHMDEDYFTNSRKFDLKRFSGQCNNKTRENHLPTFIPYGYGPRSCIGIMLKNLQFLAISYELTLLTLCAYFFPISQE